MTQQKGEADELFELKNNFYLGSYQAGINEARSIHPSSDSVALERDCFVYRSWIALGNYDIVLDEIKDTKAPASLQAIKLLASYLRGDDVEFSLETLKQWLSDDAAANNQMLQLISGIIYYNEQNYDDALRIVHQSNILEGRAFMIQMYLKLHRIDLAEKELKILQEMDDDATLTQLITAWVNLALGGEKINDAFYIFHELSEKHSTTPLLLNGLATCNMLMKKYTDAEKFLLEALEKNPKDPDTLTNLISCLTMQGKSKEAARYLNQMKTSFPKHVFVQRLTKLDENFSNAAQRFGCS